jgi:3-oxoacid CoA-transferase subunit A
MAGKICVVEVEEIVETGEMVPGPSAPARHLCAPHRAERHPEKRIEKRTITEKAGA